MGGGVTLFRSSRGRSEMKGVGDDGALEEEES